MFPKKGTELIVTDLDRLIRYLAFTDLDIKNYKGQVVYILQMTDHQVADKIRRELPSYAPNIQKKLQFLLKDFTAGEEQERVHCLGDVGLLDWPGFVHILKAVDWYNDKKPLIKTDDTMPPLVFGYIEYVIQRAGYTTIDVI